MRILPEQVRASISLAYLLARAADSIADLDFVESQQRERVLNGLNQTLTAPDVPDAFSTELKAFINGYDSVNQAEAHLLEKMPQILILYSELEDGDKIRVQKVVSTLIQGMLWDIRHFHREQPALVAFDSGDDLDRYTYLVAGCVGEFWTHSLIGHLPQLNNLDAKQMTLWGINLGKGLQLVNILRDLPRDLRNNRCYLPASLLQELNLTAQDLLEPHHQERIKPILRDLTDKAHQYFEDGLSYVLQLPHKEMRLRLAALWPLVIGIETLTLLWQQNEWLTPHKTVKVPRSRIYQIITYSLLCVRFDRSLTRWVSSKTQELNKAMAAR